MATTTRTRLVPADPESVWRVFADPYNLPRWYPDTVRVEGVEGDPGSKRSRFTQVLQTAKGKAVRADFRCTQASRPTRLVWSHQIEGTPFENFLREASVEFVLTPQAEGTLVRLSGHRVLRGLSRLGSPMMSHATKRTLDRALQGLANAFEEDA